MTEPVSGQESPVLSWSEIGVSLARHSRAALATVFSVGVVCLVVVLSRPSQYTATASVVPEVRSTTLPAQFSSLASLAGIGLSGAAPQQSPQFYAAVLDSRPILYAVLKRRYPTVGLPGGSTTGDSARLVDLLDGRDGSEARRLWEASRLLSKRTAIRMDPKTGIVRIAVELPAPELAASVANAFADELNRFNREVRQSQARTRRIFVETRVQEASSDLTSAEAAVRRFLLSNREYQNSPRLLFEYARLQRALTVQEELYLELRRQLDAARIAEADDQPVITMVEVAIPPQRRSAPRRRLWLATSLVLSAIVAGTAAVIRDHHASLFPGTGTALAAFAFAWRRRRT